MEVLLKPGIAHRAVPGFVVRGAARVIVNANNVVNQDFGKGWFTAAIS